MECPRCKVALHHVKAEYEGGYLFQPEFWECPKCDWQPGDTELTCDNCGEWSDERVDVYGNGDPKTDFQLCLDCAKAEYVQCPRCDEWGSPDRHGENKVCRVCAKDIVADYERVHGLRRATA